MRAVARTLHGALMAKRIVRDPRARTPVPVRLTSRGRELVTALEAVAVLVTTCDQGWTPVSEKQGHLSKPLCASYRSTLRRPPG